MEMIARSAVLRLMLWIGWIVTAVPSVQAREPALASVNMLGSFGLNTTPTARSADNGDIWLGGSVTDPYLHAFLGMQISDSLSLVVRQTGQVSNPLKDPDRFFPGIDAKLRLQEEGRYTPQIALGLQSASGHARMGGEYLVASKRYNDWDFSAGIGWGRYGSAFHIDNPLKALSSHFGRARDLDSELPVRPQNWLTGDAVGFFGGVEYFTALKGLSLKADIGADRYEAEKAAFAYKAPAPWSAGLNYQAALGKGIVMDTSLAAQGIDRLAARLSFRQNAQNWRAAPRMKASIPMARVRPITQSQSPDAAAVSAQRDGVALTHLYAPAGAHRMEAQLVYNPAYSLPSQVGVAAVHMAGEADPGVERLDIATGFLGLKGPTISLQRGALEKAYRHDGSAAELWQSGAVIAADEAHPEAGALTKRSRAAETRFGVMPFQLILDEQISLAEEDYGALHRTSLIAKMLLPRKTGYLDYGAALRVNVADNLQRIEAVRPKSLLPVRSDVAGFANDTLALEEAYTAFTHTLGHGVHIAAQSGYLEEMYAGLGGEILYRPFKSRFALGAQSYLALKRDPQSSLHLGLSGDHVLTSEVNGYYDLPGSANTTLTAKIGRFLDEDLGGQIGFIKRFTSGAQLSGYVTLSNHADPDLFGGTTHADHGLRLSLPLGGFKYMPDYASARISAQPFGRDIGQSLHKPLDLYELTTPFSLPHIAQHWDEVIGE